MSKEEAKKQINEFIELYNRWNSKEFLEAKRYNLGDESEEGVQIYKNDIIAVQTVLQLLEEKENKINVLEDETYKMSEYMKEIATKRNKAIDKLKEVKREFLDFCPDCVDLAGELLDLLEE